MSADRNSDETLPGVPIDPPMTDTGVRPVLNPRMPGDSAAQLTEILTRVINSAEVAEANRGTLDQILKENVRIASSLDGLRGDNETLKRYNADLKRMNGDLFREVQEFRYNLERRVQEVERRVWNVEARVDVLEGRKAPNADRPTPDPSTPSDR